MRKKFLTRSLKIGALLGLFAAIVCTNVYAQTNEEPCVVTESKAPLLYGVIYKWHLPPSMKESELINDFKSMGDIATKEGALVSKLYRTNKKGEYIGVQFWPSLEKYDAWFDQKNFKFRQPQPKETMDLIKKIQDVYKNQFLDEIKEIV